MSTFQKTVLHVGQYRSPDGIIEVTPMRLKHWSDAVKRIQAANYQIPVQWNHAELSDVQNLEPIKRLNAGPQSQNTCGRLVDFCVSPNGNSAELTIEALTSDAQESVEKNAVFVSPVLFDQWVDGRGILHSDIIGSVDLVDYPVDNSQGPFRPVRLSTLRLSTKSRIFRLSTEPAMDEEEQQTNDDSQETTQDPPQSTSLLTSVLQGLSEMQLVLPGDTNTENFLERLNTALMTAAAMKADQTPVEETEVADPGASEAVTPTIATMSTRINSLQNRILGIERERQAQQLDDLLKSGRCTPAEFDARKRSLQVQRMSLNADGSVAESELSRWIQDRASLPKGACWSPDEKLKRMSTEATKPKDSHSPTPPADVDQQKAAKKNALRR